MRAACLFALVVASTGSVLAGTSDDAEAAGLAETERAFAQFCVEKGVRASFLIYFADDAVGFEPGPVKARETMLARPAPDAKPPYTLDWWPELVMVSASGDFGWSTGPSHRTPDPDATTAPPAHDGHYFSIWKKGTDGAWKVTLDIGIACPLDSIAPRSNARLVRTQAPQDRATARAHVGIQDGIVRAVAEGDTESVLGRFTPDARIYVDGECRVQGAESARDALRRLPVASRYEPSGGDVAASGELAVTYGRLDYSDVAGERQSRWIVNVWQRDPETGIWQVAGAAYDSPIPIASK